MDIATELIKTEVEKMLNEKIRESINRIINDFNSEKNGVEIDGIRMENLHYVISIKEER